MGRKAVGFYWTLPVPWAGFRDLPEDIDAAAKVSRTIAYQVLRIRDYAREEKFDLIREQLFIEVQPDRGTDSVTSALAKIEGFCRSHQATILYVDFAEIQGWRRQPHIADWSRQKQIEVLPVWPKAVPIDGKLFEPAAHFHDWRQRQEEWTNGKAERVARACARAEALRLAGASNAAIATALNAETLRSATGKDWTAEMVRKLLG